MFVWFWVPAVARYVPTPKTETIISAAIIVSHASPQATIEPVMIAGKRRGITIKRRYFNLVAPYIFATSLKSCLISLMAVTRVKSIGQIMATIRIKIVTKEDLPNQAIKRGKRAKEGKLCKTSKTGKSRDSSMGVMEKDKARVIAKSRETK